MSLNQDFLPHIVIDIGSSTIKCGYNEEGCPRIIIPNVWGTYKSNLINVIGDKNKVYYGNDALLNAPNLDLNYYQIGHNGKFPTNGADYERFEGMFKYIFEQGLKVKQKDYKVFLIDSIFTSTKERVMLSKILFEKLEVCQIHIEPQSIMSLYSTAKQSGLIIDSGEIYTSIVPIYEGFVISKGVEISPIAGKELTNQFMRHHKTEFDNNNVCTQYEMAKRIKEKYSEILLDNNEKEKNSEKLEFCLPDGNKIEIKNERFDIPELIFNPSNMGGSDLKGIQELILDSIGKADLMVRTELLNSIILSGGNCLIKGYKERLKLETEKIIAKSEFAKNTVKIGTHNEIKFAAWAGASGICSFGNFRDKWISKSDYEEHGPQIFEQNYIFG